MAPARRARVDAADDMGAPDADEARRAFRGIRCYERRAIAAAFAEIPRLSAKVRSSSDQSHADFACRLNAADDAMHFMRKRRGERAWLRRRRAQGQGTGIARRSRRRVRDVLFIVAVTISLRCYSACKHASRSRRAQHAIYHQYSGDDNAESSAPPRAFLAGMPLGDDDVYQRAAMHANLITRLPDDAILRCERLLFSTADDDAPGAGEAAIARISRRMGYFSLLIRSCLAHAAQAG